MGIYKALVKHDNGTAIITTSAQNARVARKQIMEAEGCPPRAILDVWRKRIWILQADYGYGQGWEDETAEETHQEIMKRAKEYRENAPSYLYRIISRPDKGDE